MYRERLEADNKRLEPLRKKQKLEGDEASTRRLLEADVMELQEKIKLEEDKMVRYKVRPSCHYPMKDSVFM